MFLQYPQSFRFIWNVTISADSALLVPAVSCSLFLRCCSCMTVFMANKMKLNDISRCRGFPYFEVVQWSSIGHRRHWPSVVKRRSLAMKPTTDRCGRRRSRHAPNSASRFATHCSPYIIIIIIVIVINFAHKKFIALQMMSYNSMVHTRLFSSFITFPFTRFKPRFSAVLQPQRTAGNRKYTAKDRIDRGKNVTFRDLPQDNRSRLPTKISGEPHKWESDITAALEKRSIHVYTNFTIRPTSTPVGVSALLVIIACCPTHPSIFQPSAVAFSRLWNTVAERHVGALTDRFQETPKDSSLQPFPTQSPVCLRSEFETL